MHKPKRHEDLKDDLHVDGGPRDLRSHRSIFRSHTAQPWSRYLDRAKAMMKGKGGKDKKMTEILPLLPHSE